MNYSMSLPVFRWMVCGFLLCACDSGTPGPLFPSTSDGSVRDGQHGTDGQGTTADGNGVGGDGQHRTEQGLYEDGSLADGAGDISEHPPDGPTVVSDGSTVVSDGPTVVSDGPTVVSDGPTVADGSALEGSVFLDIASHDTSSLHDGPGVPPVIISSSSPLPLAYVGEAYQFTFTANGGLGAGTYLWSGSPPAWTTLNANTGLLSGTPTIAANHTFQVRVDSGPVYNTKGFLLQVVVRLEPSPATDPYYEWTPGTTLDFTTLVNGGQPPYNCQFYSGPGQGSFPGNMVFDPATCTLSGDFAPTDLPGVYGFTIVVQDASGQSVEIPVVSKNGECPLSPTVVNITPPLYPARVISVPGSQYSWTLQVNDMDAPCDQAGCSTCGACYSMSMATRSPLDIANNLDCLQAGVVCLANGQFGPFKQASPVCPNFTSWQGDPTVKTHSPLRPAGHPAWVTLELNLNYSGTQLTPQCGNKNWTCHWETLEWQK